MMVWLSESEGTNVVCNTPPQSSNVSLQAMHERLAEEKSGRFFASVVGRNLTRDGMLAAKCKVSALWVHRKTWLARVEVLGTSCANPLILLLKATRLEKEAW